MQRRLIREVNKKRIEAIVRSEKLNTVRIALEKGGIIGMDVEEVWGSWVSERNLFAVAYRRIPH